MQLRLNISAGCGTLLRVRTQFAIIRLPDPAFRLASLTSSQGMLIGPGTVDVCPRKRHCSSRLRK